MGHDASGPEAGQVPMFVDVVRLCWVVGEELHAEVGHLPFETAETLLAGVQKHVVTSLTERVTHPEDP
ncbi:hypothetical protein [Micrococcus luteus]|uniref:hypothetical protein n=1 Tax=Micrococcus luteus TaxID=1270 RepID=UPI00352C9157